MKPVAVTAAPQQLATRMARLTVESAAQFWLTTKPTTAIAAKNPTPRLINAWVGNASRRVNACQAPKPAIAKLKKLNKVRAIDAILS